MIRAEIKGTRNLPAPGASVRVQVPAGPAGKAIAIPVSALRKDPSGDHVFVIRPTRAGSSAPTSARCGPARPWETRS